MCADQLPTCARISTWLIWQNLTLDFFFRARSGFVALLELVRHIEPIEAKSQKAFNCRPNDGILFAAQYLTRSQKMVTITSYILIRHVILLRLTLSPAERSPELITGASHITPDVLADYLSNDIIVYGPMT